jgi:hypothetical protein
VLAPVKDVNAPVNVALTVLEAAVELTVKYVPTLTDEVTYKELPTVTVFAAVTLFVDVLKANAE